MKKTHTRSAEFTAADLRQALCAYLHLHKSSFPADHLTVEITGNPESAITMSWTDVENMEPSE
jgi:hypothetical protein